MFPRTRTSPRLRRAWLRSARRSAVRCRVPSDPGSSGMAPRAFSASCVARQTGQSCGSGPVCLRLVGMSPPLGGEAAGEPARLAEYGLVGKCQGEGLFSGRGLGHLGGHERTLRGNTVVGRVLETSPEREGEQVLALRNLDAAHEGVTARRVIGRDLDDGGPLG